MAHEESCLCLLSKSSVAGVLVSHWSGEHSQKGRDMLMKAQQLCVKVVRCSFSLPGAALG